MLNYKLTSNKTYSLAYAVFEILGSEYKACHFRNSLEESKLSANFHILNKTEQYALEDKAIAFVKGLNLNLSDFKSEVDFKRENGKYILCFRDYIHDLKVEVDCKGTVSLL